MILQIGDKVLNEKITAIKKAVSPSIFLDVACLIDHTTIRIKVILITTKKEIKLSSHPDL